MILIFKQLPITDFANRIQSSRRQNAGSPENTGFPANLPGQPVTQSGQTFFPAEKHDFQRG